jgi:hypothetical protein
MKSVSYKTCLNCENTFDGSFRFCPYCGQENKEIRLGFKYLVGDFLAGSFNIDSKFFLSFKYLIKKPAFLTREFLKGKRASYLSPLRIYLLVSLVYFTVISLPDRSLVNFSDSSVVKNDSLVYDAATDSTASKNENSVFTTINISEPDTTTILGVDVKTIKSLNTANGRKEFNKQITKFVSYSMFFVMPVAALFLFLFFGRGTYYFQHLTFLIHLQSLIFLILTVLNLVEMITSFGFVISMGKLLVFVTAVIWIKKFYNYRWFKAAAATFLFFMSYLIVLGVTFLLLAWVSLLVL